MASTVMSANNWSEQDARRHQNSNVVVPRSDTEEYLSRMYMETVGDKIEEMLYKPSNATKAGDWSSNKASSTMGNGKEYFAELRKQVISLSEKEKAGG